MEVFTSIQGEGFHLGKQASFIRLAGCNLRCPFCDTKESWDMSTAKKMSVRDILDNIQAEHVVITGGEPTIHNLSPLLCALSDSHKYIAIETNGTSSISGSHLIQWVTASPKAEANYKIHQDLRADEFKYVVNDDFDIGVVPTCVRRQYAGRIWLQPDSTDMQYNWNKCMALALANPWARVGVQLHKLMGVR
ncbi:7-carboxy-7-deazaguanine synthase QueE [uncultured Duncaniella sp.]|uniref:7-carboxy-7-deazaguanine synthase QueE n=1 Tax=uncultured Duncaniella sp. TaxID=2768039 RepID=UPI002611A5FC|nr:7-carboxy-7-deazaguanine synthase QueE [uncultured Duncaniella sp.]